MCWLAVESVNETSCLGRLFSFSESVHERNADARRQGGRHRIQKEEHTRAVTEVNTVCPIPLIC